MSPQARSMKMLRELGYEVTRVERWNPHSRTRHDAFGFGDLLVMRTGEIALVQVTSYSNLNARIAKAQALPLFYPWLRSTHGVQVHFHGWVKRRNRWYCRTFSFHTYVLSSDTRIFKRGPTWFPSDPADTQKKRSAPSGPASSRRRRAGKARPRSASRRSGTRRAAAK